MAWLGTYTASDKHHAPKNGPAIQDYIIASVFPNPEYLELLDISVHIVTCTCGDHAQILSYNDGTYHECTKNYILTLVKSVRSVTQRYSVVVLVNFFNREKFC